MPIPVSWPTCLLVGVLAIGRAWGADLTEGDLQEDGKALIHYAIHVPAGAASGSVPTPAADGRKPLGLFLCFHEHIQDVHAEGVHVVEALERLHLVDDYVVIAPKASGAIQNYTAGDRVGLGKLITWAQNAYPIDPRRIFIWGRGAGAQFGGVYALKHPDLIAGAILFSWGFQWEQKFADPQAMPDIYYALGLKDLDTHVAKVRATYGLLRDFGLHIIYREAAGFGGVTNHPATNDEAITWAHQTRHKTAPLAPADVAVLRTFSAVRAGGATSADRFRKLVDIGGAQAGAVLAPFLSATEEHVRLAAIAACAQALFGDEVATTLGKALVDPSVRIRQAVIAALTHQAIFRSAPAQHALAGLALSATADPGDRGLAVGGLVQVLARQSEGAFQDVDLFATLVTLLGDRDAGLRSRVFAFLQPLHDSAYHPEAGEAERHAALTDWQTWVDGLRGNTGLGKHTGPMQKH